MYNSMNETPMIMHQCRHLSGSLHYPETREKRNRKSSSSINRQLEREVAYIENSYIQGKPVARTGDFSVDAALHQQVVKAPETHRIL